MNYVCIWRKKTALKDKNVIDHIYSKQRDGDYITKYDELIKMYRDDYSILNLYLIINLLAMPPWRGPNTQ